VNVDKPGGIDYDYKNEQFKYIKKNMPADGW
jgi:hypothetical protein